MKKLISISAHPISPTKKRLFLFITLLIPILFLVGLELSLEFFRYGDTTELFISTPDESSPYYGINLNICKRYFTWSFFNPSPRKDLFLKEKPKNGYRIFVLGESTTAGFPYGNNLTFTRILNRRLSDTFPDQRIEVINTAFTAINSYTLLDFMDEILKQHPDALLIYTGHNEYYGALGVGSMESSGKIYGVVRAYLKLLRFKSFVMLRDVIVQVFTSIKGTSDEEIIKDPMKTEMSHIVKEKNIPFRNNLYELGKNQFHQNLKCILQKSKDAGLPVILSELVCNVRDQPPFVSMESDSFASAQKMFETARRLESEKKYDEAKKAYYEAKDLDALRFRAPEEFNEIIHTLAKEFAVPVVPMKSYFESASPHGLIGNNLMNDHLHPTIDGYFLMADAFYNTMQHENFISNGWQKRSTKTRSYYRDHWGITPLDSVYAALTILHLKGGWPFKMEGPNIALNHYHPSTQEDSIVLDILTAGNLTLELGHSKMASYYEQRGDYERAFREYEALTYIVPNLDLFYEPALGILLRTKQYERALSFMQTALKYNDSGFIHKWIGQIHLVLGNTREGIEILEMARVLLPNDSQILFNLTRAYYNTHQIEKGDATLALLKNKFPNDAVSAKLEDYRRTLKGSY